MNLCKIGIHKWGPWIHFSDTLSNKMKDAKDVKINRDWIFYTDIRSCKRCNKKQEKGVGAHPLENGKC